MNVFKHLPLLLVLAFAQAAHAEGVSYTLDDNGLSSLSFNNYSFLKADWQGDLEAVNNSPHFTRADGTAYNGEEKPKSSHLDVKTATLTRTYNWGTIECVYSHEAKRLNLRLTVRNATPDVLKDINIRLAEMTFPSVPLGDTPEAGMFGTGGPHPLHQYPLGASASTVPPVIAIEYEGGALDVCNDDMNPAASISVPFSGNQPAGTQYPVWASLSSIKAGGTASATFSLRFGAPRTAGLNLAPELYGRFAFAHPFKVEWDDRRPIGSLFLATSEKHPANNPRGWFLNAADIDTTTPAGRAAFQARVMEFARSSVKVIKAMNAQGMILWDPSGEEFASATYYGDPRLVPTLAPEIEPIIDAFFKTFRDAGLRVGTCLRPQQIFMKDGVPSQGETSDASQLLTDEIAYARKRWGCTLFYIDSTVDKNGPLDAEVFRKVAALYPDVALFPENENLLYYAYTSPLNSFAHHGVTSTPKGAQQVYPGSFSLIMAMDGDIDAHHDALLASVKKGDILLFHGWWDNPNNAKIKAIYDEAGVAPATHLISPRDGTTFKAHSNIILQAAPAESNGVKPNGTMTIEFFCSKADGGTVKLGEAKSAPYRLVWRNAPAGRFVLTIRASKNGLSRTSASHSIIVK